MECIKCNNMSDVFRKCSNFNQSLNDWDVSNVKNMKLMFFDFQLELM